MLFGWQNIHHWVLAFLQTGNTAILSGQTIDGFHNNIFASVRTLSWRRLEVRDFLHLTFGVENEGIEIWMTAQLMVAWTEINEFLNCFSLVLAEVTSTSQLYTTFLYPWHFTDSTCSTSLRRIYWHRLNQCWNSVPWNQSFSYRSGKVSFALKLLHNFTQNANTAKTKNRKNIFFYFTNSILQWLWVYVLSKVISTVILKAILCKKAVRTPFFSLTAVSELNLWKMSSQLFFVINFQWKFSM